MTAPIHTPLLATCAIGALVVWRLYARIRRAIGRQRLSPLRPWISLTVFPLILLLILLRSIGHPLAAAGLLVGVGIGIALGIFGTRLTKFEATPAGLFYTPNAHLGIALSVLLVLRLGYRILSIYVAGQGLDPASLQLGRSPLTLTIFATLATYYMTYAVGLLRWRAQVRAQD